MGEMIALQGKNIVLGNAADKIKKRAGFNRLVQIKTDIFSL